MKSMTEKFTGGVLRAGDSEYMEYRKQQLKKLSQDSLKKRKAKLLERLNKKN